MTMVQKYLLGIFFGFTVLGFVIYGASLDNEFVRWDDGLLIFENPAIREISPQTLWTIFTTYDPELYIPLTLFSYQLDFQIGGIDPFIYHLHSLLLHIGSAVLLSVFGYLLLRRWEVGIIAGLIFLVHPINVEAVAWASGRKDLLSAVFFLLSLCLYLPSIDNSEANPRYGDRFRYGSMIAFALSLMSKVTGVTLPIILLLIDWYRKRPLTINLLLEKIPYFLLSILFGIIALYGKVNVVGKSSLEEKILINIKSTVFYLQELFIPTGYSVLHVLTETISWSTPSFIVSSVILSAIAALLIVALWKRWSIIVFGILFYLLTLLPTGMNFAKSSVELYFASDRYAYIPSMGILLIVATVCSFLISRIEGKIAVAHRAAVSVLVGGLVCILMFFSFQYVSTWKDTYSVFQNVLKQYSHSHVAHANVGGDYRRRGDLEKAEASYRAALATSPHSRTMSNLAAIMRQKGEYAKAIELYLQAHNMDPSKPEPSHGLGVVMVELGRYDEARMQYNLSLSADPDNAEVLSNMGALSALQGDLQAAVVEYEKALAINPYYVQARYNLGVALAKLGRIEEAISAYQRAVKDEPLLIAARLNLAILLYGRGDTRGAEEQFRAVLAINPENTAARSALQQLQGQ